MKVLFATAELAPLVKVGGLAYATSGLVKALHRHGIDVTVVVPDYGTFDADLGDPDPLDMPAWVGITTVRHGHFAGDIPLIAVRTPEIERPHPYDDPDGHGWDDNDYRFMAFSAAVAELVPRLAPDVLHLNDWHTAATLGLLEAPVPSVFTIHNLAYQGSTAASWLEVLRRRPGAYEWYGTMNPMSGAIALADVVVTVSPNYASEIRHADNGSGLHLPLASRGDDLIGIRNGIDTEIWSPQHDPLIPRTYATGDVAGKKVARKALASRVGWTGSAAPGAQEAMIGIVTRLTWQKGVDLALDLVPYLESLPARLVILGSGDRTQADHARHLARLHPDRMAFVDAFDEKLAHIIFAGSDLLLMPSRFEPCGLAQMQAMAYGTIPIVTDVGGLHDTVVDGDRNPDDGTGFVARSVTPLAVLDALHRAVRAWSNPRRRATLQLNGMGTDWSWEAPAAEQERIYRRITEG